MRTSFWPAALLPVLGALVSGCAALFGITSRPEPGPCDNRPPDSPPPVEAVYEHREPESTVPLGGEMPPVRLSRVAFAEDAWAKEVFPTLPPRDAPALRDSVLVCAFTAEAVRDIDGIDTPSGTLFGVSTPDLLVWADFDGRKLNKGPNLASRSAVFPFKVDLDTGDPVTFTFGDFDFLSRNDYVGRIAGKYTGKLPFTVAGKGGIAVCRAASPAHLATEARSAEVRLSELLDQLDAYRPAVAEPLARRILANIEHELGVIEYFESTARAAALQAEHAGRIESACRKHWESHAAMVRRTHESATPPGQWVTLNELAEVRTAGLRCQTGRRLVETCLPEIEVRLRKPADGALCPVGGDSLGTIGPVRAIRADGVATSALVDDVRIGDRWVLDQKELASLPPGTVLRLPLFLGGTFWRPTHVKWDIPLIQVGTTYLRLY